jgi:hypothetical protein
MPSLTVPDVAFADVRGNHMPHAADGYAVRIRRQCRARPGNPLQTDKFGTTDYNGVNTYTSGGVTVNGVGATEGVCR